MFITNISWYLYMSIPSGKQPHNYGTSRFFFHGKKSLNKWCWFWFFSSSLCQKSIEITSKRVQTNDGPDSPTKALPSLIEIFHQLDADKSGQITHDEVGKKICPDPLKSGTRPGFTNHRSGTIPPFFIGKSTISMAMFNSYCNKLPEGWDERCLNSRILWEFHQ